MAINARSVTQADGWTCIIYRMPELDVRRCQIYKCCAEVVTMQSMGKDETMKLDIWSWSDEKMTEYLREWMKERGQNLPIEWKPTKLLTDVWVCVNEIAYMRGTVTSRNEGVNFSNAMYESHGDLWNGCKEGDAARRLSCTLIYAIENARLGEIV